MKQLRKHARAVAAASSVLSLAVVGVVAAAQDGAPAATSAAAAAETVPVATFQQTPARDVAARLSKASGRVVLVDPTLAGAPLTLTTLAGPLPSVLKDVAAKLPDGTTVKTVLLPSSLVRRTGPAALDAAKVAALAAAQDALAPEKPGAAADLVVIQGERLSAEKAAPVVAALNLEPVYLLARGGTDDPVNTLNAHQAEAIKLWLSMTPEQQKAAADKQFDALLTMDPALRRQIFDQQRQAMGNFFQRAQHLPEAQRQQFFREMTGGRWDGTARPPQPQQGNTQAP